MASLAQAADLATMGIEDLVRIEDLPIVLVARALEAVLTAARVLVELAILGLLLRRTR